MIVRITPRVPKPLAVVLLLSCEHAVSDCFWPGGGLESGHNI